MFPLHFVGGLGSVDGVANPSDPPAVRAASEDALVTQIQLAASVGVRLLSVEVSMGSFIAHNNSLTADAKGLLRRVRQLVPDSFLVLRVTFYGGVASKDNPEVEIQHVNGSTTSCGCTSINGGLTCASPTQRWADTAAAQLKLLLTAADAVVPGMIASVQLGGLSTFEWMLPHPPGIPLGYFPDYSSVLQQEWCASRGERGGCHVPTPAERNSPDEGSSNIFVGVAGNQSVVEWNNFTAHRVARTIATLAQAAKEVSTGNLFVFAYYGYIFHSYRELPFTGHTAMGWLVKQPSIDAIGSPELYADAARGPHGGLLSEGPWNTPATADKLWVQSFSQKRVIMSYFNMILSLTN